MASRTEVIETTAGEVAAELTRRGVKPGERVTITLESDAAAAARPSLAEIAARMRKTAAARGLTTEIFDSLSRAALMRVVVDTNVLVSILIRPGDGFVALANFLDQRATALYSTDTLTELVDVLRRQKFARYTTAEDVTAFVEWIHSTGELVAIEAGEVAGSRDPKDDKFLALALSGRADYLITGDKDLLVLKNVGLVPIVSPADFLAKIGEPKATG